MQITHFHGASNSVQLTDEGRAHAAIALRVPMSGIPELDLMIRAARLADMAQAALAGALASDPNAGPKDASEYARSVADSALQALGGCWVGPQEPAQQEAAAPEAEDENHMAALKAGEL